jgi:hypothetical protein
MTNRVAANLLMMWLSGSFVTTKHLKGLVSVIALGFAVFITIEGQSRTIAAGANVGQQKPANERTAEQVYKNIQVLKELRASELDGVMNFMCAALGVGCTYCHTNPWESDQKTAKNAARRMIQMTRGINAEHFSGNPAITCYTCHRGQHNSVPNPPVDIATDKTPDPEASAPKATLPHSDEVIENYVRAVGGAGAIAAITTRVSRGTETTTNRMTPPQKLSIEIMQTAPDKLVIVRNDVRGTTTEGFDGVAGWIKDERGSHEFQDSKLTGLKKDADFFRYLKIRDTYPQMRLLERDKIGDREVYVIGATSREGDRDKLYFDVANGLLVRKSTAFRTAFGTIPEVTEFSDYRDVRGVKLPFNITWSRPPFGYVRVFTEIKLNSQIDPLRFRIDAK